MLTVRAMSGMSHPIPAHLVLMSRRQVLGEKDENFANVTGKDSTQLPRQPKHAPFPRVCCHHWAFQSKTRQNREAQETQPSPLQDKTQHSIDVPLKRLQIENRRWKTPTKRPPSSSKLGSAGRCLAGCKKWSTPSLPVQKCRGWPWTTHELWNHLITVTSFI